MHKKEPYKTITQGEKTALKRFIQVLPQEPHKYTLFINLLEEF